MAVFKRMPKSISYNTIILLSLLIILVFLPHPVIANGSTAFGGEGWLEFDDYNDYPIEMGNGGGRLDYSVRVLSGPRLDIILFDEDDYNAFISGEPADYIEEGSALDRYEVSLSTNLKSGDYYLVFDNTDYGAAAPPTQDEEGGVYFEYNVEYTTTDLPLGDMNWILMVPVVIFTVIIIFLIFFFIINKKEKQKTFQSSQYEPVSYQETEEQLYPYPLHYPDSSYIPCKSCGNMVQKDSDFCPVCGFRINSKSENP